MYNNMQYTSKQCVAIINDFNTIEYFSLAYSLT